MGGSRQAWDDVSPHLNVALGGNHSRFHSQFEEGIGDLQHQDVRMVMLMADQDPFASPPHAIAIIVLFQAFQAREDGWVFFWLCLLGTESVVAERVESDRF